MSEIRPIRWLHEERCLELLDQRVLPLEERWRRCWDVATIAEAIQDMTVRGAPAIGITAAYGVVLGLGALADAGRIDDAQARAQVFGRLLQTRPTAVNLAWGLERMRAESERLLREFDSGDSGALDGLWTGLEAEADRILAEDIEVNQHIGAHGADLITDGMGVLTHCNAGALATGGYGTALGIIRSAWAQGKRFTVFADETRPRQQGARLTVWELVQDGIDVRLITDNMAASLMRTGRIHLAITGADRVARNGDTANKIGTYGVAVLCHHHGLPFHIAAPLSTLDPALTEGSGIPIEERDGDEVRVINDAPVTVPDVPVENPGFDVTPAALIASVITEHGAFEPKAIDAYLRGRGL
jgi:methylthioribose-1-phosphate isomerase